MYSNKTMKRSLTNNKRRQSSMMSKFNMPALKKYSTKKRKASINSKTSGSSSDGTMPESKVKNNILQLVSVDDFDLKSLELIKKTRFYSLARVNCKKIDKKFIAKIYQKSVLESNILHDNLKSMVEQDISLSFDVLSKKEKLHGKILFPLRLFETWNMKILIYTDIQERIDWKSEQLNLTSKIQHLTLISEALIQAESESVFIGDVGNLELVKMKDGTVKVVDLNNLVYSSDSVLCQDQLRKNDMVPPEIERRGRPEDKTISWSFGMLMLKTLTEDGVLKVCNHTGLRTIRSSKSLDSKIRDIILNLLLPNSVSRKSLKQTHKLLVSFIQSRYGGRNTAEALSFMSKDSSSKRKEESVSSQNSPMLKPKLSIPRDKYARRASMATMKKNYLNSVTRKKRRESLNQRRMNADDVATPSNRIKRNKSFFNPKKNLSGNRQETGFFAKFIDFLGCV